MTMNGYQKLALAIVLSPIVLTVSACGPRVIISTGTTIGLKATPGDGNTRPPQVTFGYKRAETALVPTKGGKATSSADAFSTLAAIHFSTEWFGATELQSFVGTGIAARDIQGSSDFQDQFAAATLGQVPDEIEARRERLVPQWQGLTEPEAQRVMDLAGYSKKSGKNAQQSLQDFILDAQSEPQLTRLESAFNRLH